MGSLPFLGESLSDKCGLAEAWLAGFVILSCSWLGPFDIKNL